MGMARTTTAPTGQIPPLGLRMLPQMRERIEQAARESGRSLNAEIVHRLAQTLGEDFAAEQPAAQPVLAEMACYLRELRDMARAQAEQSRQSALTALD
jgi:hypothetical protein